jgi:sec-independent protein translocase protein TatA
MMQCLPTTPLFAFLGIGTLELLVVFTVMLLLFGNRLPSLMRSLGQGITEFKKGIRDEPAKESPPRLPQD